MMIIAVAQFSPTHSAPDENIKKVEGLIKNIKSDLFILPEMFTTGYLHESRESLTAFAEPVPVGPTTQSLIRISREKNAYIVAGIVELFEGLIFNTAVIVGPNGFMGKYQKQHLTPLEEKLFARGNKSELFKIKDALIGVVICFDSWYGEITRDLAMQGAQIICSPANFGGPQSLTIASARAIENNIYFVTANRIGKEKLNDLEVTFRGSSRIISPQGEILVDAENREEVIVANIDPSMAATGTLLGADHGKELERHHGKTGLNKHI
jgi:predicted amidohydrolase